MKEILDFAVRLAEDAGRITLKYYGRHIKVESKADLSPVTIADRETEEFLRKEIEKRFPDDGILGEEFGEKKGKSGYRWILDPIDGTKTFIRTVPMYGTMIAVEHEGVSKIGVVRFPPNEETIAALTGHGCFLNGERCRVSTVSSLSEAMALTTDFSHFIQRWGQKGLVRLLKETGLQRTWGDCYGYYLVATGRAECMIDPKLSIWDVAPMIPIIEEAGGKITDSNGECSLGIDHGIASNALLHYHILKFLNG